MVSWDSDQRLGVQSSGRGLGHGTGRGSGLVLERRMFWWFGVCTFVHLYGVPSGDQLRSWSSSRWEAAEVRRMRSFTNWKEGEAALGVRDTPSSKDGR